MLGLRVLTTMLVPIYWTNTVSTLSVDHRQSFSIPECLQPAPRESIECIWCCGQYPSYSFISWMFENLQDDFCRTLHFTQLRGLPHREFYRRHCQVNGVRYHLWRRAACLFFYHEKWFTFLLCIFFLLLQHTFCSFRELICQNVRQLGE